MIAYKNEQLDAINHDIGDIMISASAGSGKTFIMIERAIRLIEQGKATVEQILAVTFTDAATMEMKEKLKNALIKKINEGKKNLLEQVALIPTADVCTIHSFCARLVRKYFFSAGVSPDFAVCDETRATLLQKHALEKTFKYFYDKKEDWFLSLTNKFRDDQRSDQEFKQTIVNLYKFYNSEVDPLKKAEQFEQNYSNSGFSEVIDVLKDGIDDKIRCFISVTSKALEHIDQNAYPKLYNLAQTLLLDYQTALDGSIFDLKQYANFSRPLYIEKKLDDLTKTYKQDVVLARDAFKKLLNYYIDHIPEKENLEKIRQNLLLVSRQIFTVLKEFYKNYQKEKQEENCLDFEDLQHYALKVLSDDEIRRQLKNKYKYIFVDEYQDVNGVQEKILSCLSSDNVFMVGDVKQSIYGFRGCRPENFTAKFNAMQKLGKKAVMLNYNFRSADSILDFANKVFSFCMTKNSFGEDYNPQYLLKSGGLYVDQENIAAKGRVELHFLSKPPAESKKEQPRIYNVLEEWQKSEQKEEGDICTLISSIVEKEVGNLYFDSKEKKYKKITFGDIVVLSRNRNDNYIPKVVNGLALRGVPVSSEVKQNVLDFPEIQVVVNALKLIDCFLQDIPLLSTLKSPMGNLKEEDFASISLFYKNNCLKRGGFKEAFEFYRQNANTDLKIKLDNFCNYIDNVRFLSCFLGAKGILDKIIEDCGYENYLLATSGGEGKLKRLNKFLSCSVSASKELSVSEFLERIELSRDDFTLSECSEEDCIRFMTMHASKGLEFPVVIVCGTERKFSSKEEEGKILFDRDFGFAVNYFNEQEKTFSISPLQLLVKNKMRENRIKEEMRLFYVALTRAQYSMHVTIEGKEDIRQNQFLGAEKWCEFIPKNIVASTYTQQDFERLNSRQNARKVLLGKGDEELAEKMKNNLSFIYPYLQQTTLPLKTSVTANLDYDKDNLQYITLFEEQGDSAQRGTIAHKILEHYDFDSPIDIIAQAKALVDNKVITQQELNLVNLDRLKNALSNPVFDLKGKTLYREQSFLVQLNANQILPVESKEDVVLQGIIDLLVIDNDTAQIIDYKYSTLTVQSLKEKYKKQLDLYAQAVEKVLNRKVTKKVLVNVFSGEVVIV